MTLWQLLPSILTQTLGIFANIPQLSPQERHRTLTHSFNQWAWCVPQNRSLEQ
ncbi:hypothetical protein O53_1410 [Microcystis aeruginosa TAIHU98]|uniref:Uncharacterized protein n=1 Tax=Microcystis aeruginosa TAIHU98 TaxID=1134457 RepID=L7ED54_MICAE|nr:hypothetical protein O53_1410 [Microcystis aeruginosa TAIHU98]ODV39797.1 hypothetical protein BFG60_0656 [Microcystis aeruginosa NIES-98]